MRKSIIGSILLSVAGSVGGLLAQDSAVGVSRIVAVGDVHGDFAQFTTVLRQAGGGAITTAARRLVPPRSA